MSLLAKQLQQIKNSQRAMKVAPQQQQPTLLLDTHTATTTSPDLIYTFSILSYSKLLTQQPQLKDEGQVVMGNQYKEINRNTLTKQTNRLLSEKLIKFMLKISPFFLGEDCQRVLQYLLHNFKVNIFEAESLAIIYLQYWNSPVYQKLISNIPDKLLSVKLPFLLKLNSQEPHNLTYIVKSVAYSHFLMSSLVMYTLEYLKIEGFENTVMDIEINLGDQLTEQRESIVKCDPRRFLLQIFSEFISRQMVSCYKYVIDFCAKAIRPNQQVSAETCSMVMLLTTRLLLQQLISEELVSALLIKLLKNSYFHNERAQQQLFDFTLIVWQRKPACITRLVVPYLQSSQNFIRYLSQFKCSLWMILVRLLQLWSDGVQCRLLLGCVGGRVKESEFYVLHQEQYLVKLFQFFNRIVQEQANRQELLFLQNWFYENFAYEMAVYYHKKPIASELLKQALVSMFQKQFLTLSKNGHFIFNVALIPKKAIVVEKPSEEVEEAHSSEEDIEQQQSQAGQKKQPSSLITLLRAKGWQLTAINYGDQQTKAGLLQLVSEFYAQGNASKITPKQKNQILEQYLQSYTNQWFQNDLQLKDFSTPIKYLSKTSDLGRSMKVLLSIEADLAILEDVLFRQLFRLSLSQVTVALPSQYKQTIHFLNTFFKNLMRKYIGNLSEPTQLLKLSEILLKVSATVFGKNGIRKGKFHRLLHSHGRLIAEMIIRLKSKQTASKHLADYERSILDHYLTTLKTYDADNAYLLNIGIVEILTRKTMDHNHIKYFINKVILKTIHEAGLDCHGLMFSLAKTLVFCSQFGPTINLDQSAIEPSLCSGIAKSVLADFFGLIKDKFRRVLVKKLLLFIRSIFQSNHFIEYFKTHLVELSGEDLTALLSLFTQFYKILSLLVSEDAQVQQFRETIMDKITNVFPLNLRLVLFEPLLPNQQLYAYLANQLEEHSAERSQFEQLATLINIVPQNVTFEWVKFVRECLKRGNRPAESLLDAVFANYSTQSNVNSYSQLICDFAQFCPELLYVHLPASIEIIESHCKQPNNFTLALVSRVIRSLGEMIDPYLSHLVLASLSFDSAYTQTFIAEVTSHLVPSTLIKLIKENYKEATHISNFCLFFKEVAIKGIGSTLNKTLLNFMGRTLMTYLESEEHPGKVVELQSQIFLQIGLKMNQNELRKAIIDLVRWSEAKSEVEEGLPFNLRKIVVAKIYCLLAENLQGLFNPFFGYTFEATLKDYAAITQYFQASATPAKLGNGLKRSREQPKQQQHELIELYLRSSLKSFRLLFDNDTDHEFLDSVKIQSLGDPISELLLVAQFERYGVFVSSELIPSLIALHRCIVDDYQMKTVNYKILLLLKRKNGKVQKAVFELVEGLVEALQDRFLVLVGDLVPFLLEWAGSRHEGISKIVRRVIAKIEEISGEAIQNYAK